MSSLTPEQVRHLEIVVMFAGLVDTDRRDRQLEFAFMARRRVPSAEPEERRVRYKVDPAYRLAARASDARYRATHTKQRAAAYRARFQADPAFRASEAARHRARRAKRQHAQQGSM